MIAVTCEKNILNTITFSIKTSKDNAFIKMMKKLKEKIKYVFEAFAQDVNQIKKHVKEYISNSDLYIGSQKKIEKCLNKLK